jgi:hypothetical protein
MSKLLTALLAVGFGFGLNAAIAQDVKSDQSKADRQEQIMQQKEQDTDASKAGSRERATHTDSRTQSGESGGNASAASGQNAGSDLSSEQIPAQSMPSVGHPKEGAATGQFGVKKFNEQESGQLDQSTSGMSDQGSERQTDKRITPN